MGHSETDCRAVIEKVFLYIDGEIAGAECAEIQTHLEICARCLHHYGFERDLKALVRRKCSGEPPPSDVGERLRARLRELLDS